MKEYLDRRQASLCRKSVDLRLATMLDAADIRNILRPVDDFMDDAPAGSPPARSVTLDMVVGRCGGGECPTVYRTDRNTLVVQGYAFEPADAGVTVPDGERMVEIPVELLADYVRTMS
jgi:hypothetical protein